VRTVGQPSFVPAEPVLHIIGIRGALPTGAETITRVCALSMVHRRPAPAVPLRTNQKCPEGWRALTEHPSL